MIFLSFDEDSLLGTIFSMFSLFLSELIFMVFKIGMKTILDCLSSISGLFFSLEMLTVGNVV